MHQRPITRVAFTHETALFKDKALSLRYCAGFGSAPSLIIINNGQVWGGSCKISIVVVLASTAAAIKIVSVLVVVVIVK